MDVKIVLDGKTYDGTVSESLPPAQPQDCITSDWGDWQNSAPPGPCINGFRAQPRIRFREVLVHPTNGGAPCGPLTDSQIWQEPCAVEPAPDAPVIQYRKLNVSRTVMLMVAHEQSRYERFQRAITLSGVSATLLFRCTNFAGGGDVMPLLSDVYTLLMDGVEIARTTGTLGDMRGTFMFSLAELPDGEHLFEIGMLGGDETTAPFPMHVNKAGVADLPQDKMFVCSGSHDYFGSGNHFLVEVPAIFAPTPLPLVPRLCPHFNEPLPKALLYRTNIAPVRHGNIKRPTLDAYNMLRTMNNESYFWGTLIRKYPDITLLDGPRGVATSAMLTNVLLDRHGGAYTCTPWSVRRHRTDGTILTRCGWRHKTPADNWSLGANQELELVGDWSAIEAAGEELGFHEIWGMAWHAKSLTSDLEAPLIGAEPPHVMGPRAFVTDSQNNRVLLLTFSKDNLDAEPVVTKFIDAADPWDCAEFDDVLYVTERKSNRVGMYNAVNAQYIGYFHANAPEGIYIQDGYLYYASLAMKEVRKRNLISGEDVMFVKTVTDGNSKFVKIALSDGTFGPRGTLFSWTWSNTNFGMPLAWTPDGVRWQINAGGVVPSGKGGLWDQLGYATAGAAGDGKLFTSSSMEGFVMISKALPSDLVPDAAKYTRGYKEWMLKGYLEAYGDGGYGFYGFTLPWGESADIDYYLTMHGHAKPV